MDKERLIARLMATFLDELDGHVRAVERDVLTLERAGVDTGVLSSLSRTVHSLKGAARAVDVAPIERACHRLEEIVARVRDGEPPPFALLLETSDALADAGARLRAGQGLGDAAVVALLPRLETAARGATGSSPEPSAPPSSDAAPSQAASPDAAQAQSVRVATEKLDALLARGGDLLAEARAVERWGDEVETLREALEQARAEGRAGAREVRRALGQLDGELVVRARGALDTLDARLRDLDRGLAVLAASQARGARSLVAGVRGAEAEARRLRTVSFEEACEGLDRAARDVARAEGKQVELTVASGRVEIDRATAEALRDPLLHLVRNAVSHGIERPAERRAAGKGEQGSVTVSAEVLGDFVSVRVADDGAGISVGDVRERARGLGLEAGEDDRAALRLIFEPGLSTTRAVTEVSGRGIGLDVVSARIEALHGTVDVASRPGEGTRFTLMLPLTLGLVRALLVRAGDDVVAIPSTAVLGLRRLDVEEIRSAEGRDVALVDGELAQVASLAGTLGAGEEDLRPPDGKLSAVLVASAARSVAFVVRELLAETEVVVKPFGARVRGVRHFSGAAVLPDGRIALVLNVGEAARTASGAPRRGPAPVRGATKPERRRLLVVDDSVTTRSLVRSILESAGFEVVAASDGVDAWNLLEERGADLVVTDVQMPRMDGFELTATIRASSRFRRLPVILVTSLDSENDRLRGVEVGADAYIVKSAFDQTKLLEAIGQLL